MILYFDARFTIDESQQEIETANEPTLEELIKGTLPPNVPSFVQRIIRARKSKNAVVAIIKVFDGMCETLEVYSHNGLWRFRWLELSQTFYWDGSRWKRDALVQAELNLPEPILEEPNAVTPNMFEVPQ